MVKASIYLFIYSLVETETILVDHLMRTQTTMIVVTSAAGSRVQSFIKFISFQALKQLPREKIQLATKFGIVKMEANRVTVNGTPEYVRSCCEGSLKRLDVDYIDLYYQHRVDTSVPIEETVSVSKILSPPF